jgi:predicted 3-demethylubiquinone-9 3-methyltransferase (glyoxalase superfamily)
MERHRQQRRPGKHVRLVKRPLGIFMAIIPRALLAPTTDPDRAAAKRAMNAIMTMRKIDIAAIETARTKQ